MSKRSKKEIIEKTEDITESGSYFRSKRDLSVVVEYYWLIRRIFESAKPSTGWPRRSHNFYTREQYFIKWNKLSGKEMDKKVCKLETDFKDAVFGSEDAAKTTANTNQKKYFDAHTMKTFFTFWETGRRSFSKIFAI